MRPTIVIVGAGSVVFTRDLLGDVFSFPELSSVRVVLHDIDPERLETARAIAEATAREVGAHPEITAEADRRRALDGADYVINVIQVGMYDATVLDFEIPAGFGLNQTIADTIGIGGIFRGLRTFPVLAAIARDMAELCPDAWLLNYTNPMAMNVTFLHAVAPPAEGARPVSLGALDDGRAVRAGRGPARRGHLLVGGRQPPGLGAALGAGRERACTRCWTSGSRPTLSCDAGCAWTCTAASASTPPRPASTRASTCRGTSTTRARSIGCA